MGAKKSKLSSVKKLLLLGVVLDIPETYESVRRLLETLKIDAIEYTTQADMKLLRILVGKSGGNAKLQLH